SGMRQAGFQPISLPRAPSLTLPIVQLRIGFESRGPDTFSAPRLEVRVRMKRDGAPEPGAVSPGGRLRALMGAPEILIMPGVFDGFSAKLVERRGFKAAFITGS